MLDFEKFKEFALQSAARHDAESEMIREGLITARDSIMALSRTMEHVVENRIHLQDAMDESHRKTEESIRAMKEEMRANHKATQAEIQATQAEICELSRVVFRHVTDPEGHPRP